MKINYLTTSEAAKIKGVSRQAIWQAIYYGRLAAKEILTPRGKCFMIRPDDLNKYLPRTK